MKFTSENKYDNIIGQYEREGCGNMSYKILRDEEIKEIMETFGGDTGLSFRVLAKPGQYYPTLPVPNPDGVDTRTLVLEGYKAVQFYDRSGNELVLMKHQVRSEKERDWAVNNIRRKLKEPCSVRREIEKSF